MSNRDEKGHFQPGHELAGPGRDSLYDPSMNEQARKLALLGCTDSEIADFFGVHISTITNWKNEYPAFFASLNEGKIQADAEIADSLYRKAKGEVLSFEKVMKTSDNERPYEIITLKQHVQGDAGAAKLWLTNRQPDKWRDKREHSHTGELSLTTKEQRDAAVAAATRADS